MGFHGSLWGEKTNPNRKHFLVDVIFLGDVGPMLSNLGSKSKLDPCWVIWWALWCSMGSLEGKKTPNTKLFVLGVILGDFLGLCGANVGPVWVYVGAHVGSFGGLYGVPWRSLGWGWKTFNRKLFR